MEPIMLNCDNDVEILDLSEFITLCKSNGIEEKDIYSYLFKQNGLIADKLTEEEILSIFSKKPADDYPLNFAVLVIHYRGKTAHIDFRRKVNNHLEGETILTEVEGLIKEDVDTIEKGENRTKTLLKEGKFRPDMDPNTKVVIVAKESQPLEWLNVREAAFPPGSVGATKFEWGVFSTLDTGKVYPGVQKPYFKEFFFDMSNFKGRMVERLIPVGPKWKEKPKEPLQWQSWFNLKDQTPYLLSIRGREKRDAVPPDTVSWLPPEWEEKIRAEFNWWERKGQSDEEKLNKIDMAYNDLVERDILKGKRLVKHYVDLEMGQGILRKHWWIGQFVVRGMPVSHWDLVIHIPGENFLHEWNLDGNPIYEDRVNAFHKMSYDKTNAGAEIIKWLDFEGYVAPSNVELGEGEVSKIIEKGIYEIKIVKKGSGSDLSPGETFQSANTPELFKEGQKVFFSFREDVGYIYSGKGTVGNPNKSIPARIDILQKFEVNWIAHNEDFNSFKFQDKSFSGYWIMKRTDPNTDLWTFSRSSLPGASK